MSRSHGFVPSVRLWASPLSEVRELDFAKLRNRVVGAYREGARIVAYFGHPLGQRVGIVALVEHPDCEIEALRSTITDGKLYSITSECPQVHMFEREIAEQFGVTLIGHPWAKPVRYSQRRSDLQPFTGPRIGECEFFNIPGTDTHEVAVGPVHAGVIEPGHFRFQCWGENVYHLEISLGYQHRGAEHLLVGGPDKRSVGVVETVAGDTTVANTWAFARVIETLSGVTPSPRAESLRAVMLELERLANHAGDLGALANDVGFLPTASFCGRIRGDFLNASAVLCGSRLGRGIIRPGGVRYDPTAEECVDVAKRVSIALRDLVGAANLMWENETVLSRFRGCGVVDPADAWKLGLVGPAGRSSRVARDVRVGDPLFAGLTPAIEDSCDVYARAHIRYEEIDQSARFVERVIRQLPDGAVTTPNFPKLEGVKLAPDSIVYTVVEGWRGDVRHIALTDPSGKFSRYKLIDPSFFNWTGLGLALRGEEISNFPLNNKSFNLSYCGFDL